MGSSRLPKKTLADVAGKPLLERVLRQISESEFLDEIVVATSSKKEDDAIEELCKNINFNCFRGSTNDVLMRYIGAARSWDADIVVRLTGDCPLHSSDTIDEVVCAFLNKEADYACNTNPYTRPEGQDVEVFYFDQLLRAEKNATAAFDREHVTPWIKRQNDISILNFLHTETGDSILRMSVDYYDDLDFVRCVWEQLKKTTKNTYSYGDIMTAIKRSNARHGQSIINEGYYLSIFNEASDTAAKPQNLDKSFEWLKRSDKVVPGAAQTYSKSWRHHIRGVTPLFLETGAGAVVTDVDGNKYVDLIQGLLPNILGYAHEQVNEAVYSRSKNGHSFSLPHSIEVELAERLCKLIPCAEMVRFGKNGSDATAGAVRAARAYTGKERVIVCGYHGWQDWFIGSTSRNAGVPVCVQELVETVEYNNLDQLEEVLKKYPGEFAAMIMEPMNFHWPHPGYLEKVKELVNSHGALLIFDEICSGFHFGLGGAQKLLNVTPDMATFGKAMGNGWPISCIVGRRDIMKIFEDAFVSFTFAGDAAAMTAAMKVLDMLENEDTYAKMTAAGTKLFDGAKVMAKAAGLENEFQLQGHPHWPIFSFVDKDGQMDRATTALWVQEVTRRGVLILTTFNICAALDEANVTTVLNAFAHAFKRVQKARNEGVSAEKWLAGPVPVPAFKVRG